MKITLPRYNYLSTSLKNITVIEKGKAIKVNGRTINTTQRFWDSMCSRFGLSLSSFNIFNPNDVIQKIAENNNPDITLVTQLTAFNNEEGFEPCLLAVSGTERPSIDIDHLTDIMKNLGVLMVEYHKGVFSLRFAPRSALEFDVAGDKLVSRFVAEVPIDGYGKPNIWIGFMDKEDKILYLGMNKQYQSGINFGKDGNPKETLRRIIESFSNEDGYMALKERIEMANNSWASVGEIVAFIKLIWSFSLADFSKKYIKSFRQTDENEQKLMIVRQLEECTGDLRAIYGVTDLDGLSDRKQRSLPTKMDAYWFLKFMCKKTALFVPPAKRKLQQMAGSFLTREYDLEDSKKQFPDFADFFAKETSQPAGSDIILPEEKDPADWWKETNNDKGD